MLTRKPRKNEIITLDGTDRWKVVECDPGHFGICRLELVGDSKRKNCFIFRFASDGAWNKYATIVKDDVFDDTTMGPTQDMIDEAERNR